MMNQPWRRLMTLGQNWSTKSLAVRGAIAVLFGVIVLLLPGAALFAIVMAFGAWALLDGLLALVAATSRQPRTPRKWLVAEAAFGVLAGVVAFSAPQLTAIALIYLIGAWAVINGTFKISAAIQFRKEMRGEGILILGGIGSVLLGVLLFVMPVAGALAITWVLGAFGLLWGGLLLFLAGRYRFLKHEAEKRPRAA